MGDRRLRRHLQRLKLVADCGRQRLLFGARAQVFEALCYRCERAWRQHGVVFAEIVQGVERGLSVARARKAAGDIARLVRSVRALSPTIGSARRRKARQRFTARRKS